MTLQFRSLHLVASRRAPVAFYRSQRSSAVLVREEHFHQLLVHRSLSEDWRNPACSLRPRLATAAPSLPTGTSGLATAVVTHGIRALLFRRSPVPSSLRPLVTSRWLSPPGISPGKVQNRSFRAAWLYLMSLDDRWASLFPASLPPAPGLPASSCSSSRKFATRFLPASPRGYALRFATVEAASALDRKPILVAIAAG